jgi:hypothetical protein
MKQRLRVAIQGERGSFSEEAATKLLGRQIYPALRDIRQRFFDGQERPGRPVCTADREYSGRNRA